MFDFTQSLAKDLINYIYKYNDGIFSIIKIDNISIISIYETPKFIESQISSLYNILSKIDNSLVLENSYNSFFLVTTNLSESDFIKKIQSSVRNNSNFKTTIGFCFFTKSSDPKTIIKQSLASLEIASEFNQNYLCYNRSWMLIDNYYNQINSVEKFKKSIQKNDIKIIFQPVIGTKDLKTEFYETLLRINSQEDLKCIDKTIINAEKIGIIDIIDLKILHLAIQKLKSNTEVKLSINISCKTAESDNWLDDCKNLLVKIPTIAKRLIIEITETNIRINLNQIKKFTETMRSVGCKIAIDDFGAGYTSFNELKFLEIDFIKIDGFFIKKIHQNEHNLNYVKYVVNIAKALNAKTVAEFVENDKILEILKNIDVDYVQGNFIGKPSDKI